MHRSIAMFAGDLLEKAILGALRLAEDTRLPTRAFPSVYRELARLGFQWFKVDRYWFAVEETADGKVIANIVYEAADIPSRV